MSNSKVRAVGHRHLGVSPSSASVKPLASFPLQLLGAYQRGSEGGDPVHTSYFCLPLGAGLFLRIAASWREKQVSSPPEGALETGKEIEGKQKWASLLPLSFLSKNLLPRVSQGIGMSLPHGPSTELLLRLVKTKAAIGLPLPESNPVSKPC